ncbi:MAG: hypothetical protein HXY48_06975, partial [Ignavibacteriaceae bacterium]|nr:hypothetical protein [Ignavibacteriaceae bacterium]
MELKFFKLNVIVFSAILFSFSQLSIAQLSGTYTIPGSPFTTIKKAADSLNAVGIGTGGVTFNITTGYTENITSPITITATGTLSNPITFQKSGGGTNPLVTRIDGGSLTTAIRGGAGDAVIRIEGTDYITFNGLNVAATDQGIEYGYLTHKPSGTNGCQNVTITNCQITLTKGTSPFVSGIYIGNGTNSVSSNFGVTVTAASGINSNFVITGNTIQNVHDGILSIGSSATGFYDSDIIVGQTGSGNIIQNFGGVAVASSYGVYFNYVNNPNTSYNTINNAGGGGTSHTDSLFAVFHSVVSGDITVNNNSFTFNNASTRLTGVIYNKNNSVASETYNNNTFNGTLNTGTLHLIYTFSNTTPNKTVSGNVITGITKSGGGLNVYYDAGQPSGGTVTITNNDFSNITITSGSGTNYIIYSSKSTSNNMILNNNTFSNFTHSGTGTIYAINATGFNSNQISNNTISNITTGGSLYGINFSGLNASVYNNNMYGLTSNTTGSNVVNGITTQSINNNTTNLNIYNNFISDIKAPASTAFSGTTGINAISGSNVNIYYNTVFLKFTSTNASNKSSALSLGDTSPDMVDIRNNVFVNLADVTNGQFAAAIRKSGTWLLNFAASCDNNLYYAGTPSSKHLIFYDGTNADSTLIQFKNRLSPRELNSVTENPPFVNSVTPPYDLHMSTSIATQTESGGTPITSPITITTDYDSNTRNTSTPDIGADEFTGIQADLASPIILYTPLLNTSSTGVRTLVASITDPGSGVPTTPPGWPNLYWKKNTSGTWAAVTPSGVAGGVYSFNFGSGVTLNDTIYYYIVAQDLASPPNVGAYPSIGAGGFTYNPPAASTPPTTPSSYVITDIPLAGNYNIGSGGNYSTITAAVTDLNLRGVGAEVNFVLTDPVYVTGTGEVFPLEFKCSNVSKPTSTNKVNIKPNTGVVPIIQGAIASSALIKILESYINIDGSNSGGTDRSLTIQNTSTDHPSGLFFGSTGITPIIGGSLKNCNVISGANYSNPNYGILISDGVTPGIPGYFNNITIQNNNLQRSFYGIYCIAKLSSGNGSGLLITGNNLNSTSTNAIHEKGIYLEGVDGAVVSNNIIGNLGGNDAGNTFAISFGPGTINSSILNNVIGPMPGSLGGGTPTGISVSSDMINSNLIISGNEVFSLSASFGAAVTAVYVYSPMTGVTIERNKVYDIVNDNNFGFGARGIIINTGISNSDITIKNNFVWDVRASAKEFPGTWGVGIGIDGATGGVNVYHNSVNLYGTIAGSSAVSINTAFGILDANATSIDVRNNIFVNKFDNTNSTTDKSYAINSQAPNTAFTNINYNDYFVEGVVGVLGYLGGDQTTLGAWQSSTGQDLNSISGNPGFVSNADLHINPDSSTVSNIGFFLSLVPNDIDGDIRNNPPDIGADEYNASSSSFQLTVNILNGWNMVSIPGLHPIDQNVDTWWQYRDPGANVFKYSGGYQIVSLATPGIGYWMKHAGARTYNTGDEWPAGGIQIVAHDPIQGTIGWNLIGGYEASVATSGMTTTPPGLIIFPVFKYSSGYQVAATLDPGYGYWVKLSGAGQINIPSSVAKGSGEIAEYFPENWGRIIVTDASGINYTLYAVKGE